MAKIKPGKSAMGKSNPKAGVLMPGSKTAASASGTGPPRQKGGLIRKPKAGK